MNRRLKLAIAALLGFSTACSTVKQAPQESEPQPDSVKMVPAIKVMYGTRPPQPRVVDAPLQQPQPADPSESAAE